MPKSETSSVQYLHGGDPASSEANRRLQEALDELTSSLDNRKRMFDPTLLAMAQGFLAPTQTGGFGESLSNVAKNVIAAQEAEDKSNQEILQKKLALAGQNVEFQRQKARDADLARFLGEDVPKPAEGPLAGPQSAPVAGPGAGPLTVAAKKTEEPSAAPTGEAPQGPLSQGTVPAPAAPAAPAIPAAPAVTPAQPPSAPATAKGPLSATQVPAGIPIMPPNPSFMSQKEYVALNRNDKGKSFAELLAKGAELEHQRYAKTEAGLIDYKTGLYYPAPSAKYLDTPIFGEGYNGKTYKIPETVAMQLQILQNQGNAEGYKALADTFTGRNNFGKSGTPLKSQTEIEISNEQEKALAKAKTEMEIETRKDFNQRKKEADETITTANVFRKFAADPNAKNMFGIFNNDKILSGVATLVRDGIGIPGFTVGTKAIEDVMRNAGLNATDQAKYRTFLTYAAMMQLQAQKYMKGAVSDYEQKLLANVGINAQDTPETIRMKADMLTRRAQFDRRVAKAFKDSKMTADEFLDSDKYMEMRDKYNQDLAELASGSKILVQPPKPASSTGNLSAARARVREELNKK